MLQNPIACLLFAATWPLAAAAAEDPQASMFSFGGFGTVGVVHSTEDRADFVASASDAVGAGHTRAWSAAVDSKVAAQVTARFNPRLSAVVQVIAQQNYNDTYTPHVEWANIKYQLIPDFSIRAGRIALPIFLVSDSRNIGYANPWVRPPVEIYSLVSVTSNDGLDASYRVPVGSASNTLQISLGRANYNFPIPNGGGVEAVRSRSQMTFVDSFESGNATALFTYGQAHVTIPAFDPLFDAFRQLGPQGVGIAERFGVNDRIISYFGVSAKYEPGNWFTMAEWGRVNTHSVLSDKTGWYVSSGYRLGKFTPYATYAHLKVDSNTSDPGVNPATLPPPLQIPAGYLNAALNGTLGTASAQRTVSIGTRWDFFKSADLKFQYDRTTLGAHSQGTLTNLQPGFQPGSTLSLFSVTIDFVF